MNGTRFRGRIAVICLSEASLFEMVDQHLTERIVVSRDVLHGRPRIAGTRIAVVQVLDLLAAGLSPERVTSEDYYPDLTIADVLACVAYARQMISDDRIVPTA